MSLYELSGQEFEDSMQQLTQLYHRSNLQFDYYDATTLHIAYGTVRTRNLITRLDCARRQRSLTDPSARILDEIIENQKVTDLTYKAEVLSPRNWRLDRAQA